MVHTQTTTHPHLRLASMWIFFVAWALLIVFRLSQIMVMERREHLESATKNGWHIEYLPAGRGRLLDAKGLPLAWSTRHFRLLWQVPREPRAAEEQWDELNTRIQPEAHWNRDKIRLFLDHQILLDNDLSSNEFQALADMLENKLAENIKIESYFKRHRIAVPKLGERIGKTILHNGIEQGISGFEKIHDNTLRGTPGMIKVFVRAEKNIIPESRQVLQDVQPGYDVYLPFTLNIKR
jgi:cell division protein FtsI/penicillin-binding protein 2